MPVADPRPRFSMLGWWMKLTFFWVVCSLKGSCFFWRRLVGRGPENPKIQAGKELFHCYDWVGSCEEHFFGFSFLTLALRLPRPPSKVEVAPWLPVELSSHWGYNWSMVLDDFETSNFIWLLGSRALTFWEFKATPASNPTLQRPRYSEVRRTDDERNPLAEAGRCKQANMWLCRNVLQCCFLQEHLTDATAGGSCNTAWITFGGHKDEWIEVGVSWICWFVDGCYVDGVQKRLENEKGRRL